MSPMRMGPSRGSTPLEALAVVELGQVLEAHAPLPGQHVFGVGGEGLAAVGHLALFTLFSKSTAWRSASFRARFSPQPSGTRQVAE